MNGIFFQKLAINGIRKNKKLYYPYLLSCMGMVMMAYILNSVGSSPLLKQMRGGGSVNMALSLGKVVIAVFSGVFLLYTNSFLGRRRNKEFGLYHILGMGKKGIRKVIFWESLMTALVGLFGGILSGILLSKLAELGLANILKAEVSYQLFLDWEPVKWTLLVYGIVFGILMLNSIIRVQRVKPMDLLHSDRVGEKPPKANRLAALLGVILLGIAYYMAVTIHTPLQALTLFFVAVILVIFATYFLMIAGSVALCKLLQKNKNYYYKKNHFVSVSTMAYRMKRNGAGLASICILSTMVLVMLSSTGSLYFGMEEMLRKNYPNDVLLNVYFPTTDSLKEENRAYYSGAFREVAERQGLTQENVLDYCYAEIAGIIGDIIYVDPDSVDVDNMVILNKLREFLFLSAEDYNRMAGTDYHPEKGEAFYIPREKSEDMENFDFGYVKLNAVKIPDDGIRLSASFLNGAVTPYYILVVSDFEQLSPLHELKDRWDYSLLELQWCYAYDLPGAERMQLEQVWKEQTDLLKQTQSRQLESGDSYGFRYYSTVREMERDDFLETFGGMFFLGIILSILFVAAATLIIYYKQISEGYEDQARFEIMQKVGMTGEDIRKSINSQVLTVFFAPLLMAGLHLAFAYPMIWKILKLFGMSNLGFVVLVTIGCFGIFGMFYGVVYKLTAKAYYDIVSGAAAR